ncbi:Restriction of telomere capping protein 5 [Savitreella phatthalungensis]
MGATESAEREAEVKPEVVAEEDKPLTIDGTVTGLDIQERLTLSQCIPRELCAGRMDDLFRASRDGFSMSALESKCLKYPGPSLLLIRSATSAGPLGVFIDTPWKHSLAKSFGERSVFFASDEGHLASYHCTVTFHKTRGVTCGEPVSDGHALAIDNVMEVCRVIILGVAKSYNIDDVEVWGLGGDREAQRKAWEWEQKETERRKQINVRDLQAEYDLLEMAGLVGQNRSGGSMN